MLRRQTLQVLATVGDSDDLYVAFGPVQDPIALVDDLK